MKKAHFTKIILTTFLLINIVFNINAINAITASQAVQYSWFYNGELLPDQNSQTVETDKAGVYTVKLQKADGSVSFESYSLSNSGTVRKLIFIGDSTASIYAMNRYPRTGWAQILQSFFNSDYIQVVDKARSGSSSVSFYSQNDWFSVRPIINEGDFVFIQFGINDNSSVPLDTFRVYLKKYIDETRAKGGIPVLCTPITKNYWNTSDTTKITETLGKYPQYVRNLSLEANVPLIDLGARTTSFYESLGKSKCTWNIFMNIRPNEYPYTEWAAGLTDNTHIQLNGATEICKLAVDAMRKMSADKDMQLLIPALQDAKLVEAKPNIPIAGIVTGNGPYAIGQIVSLQAVVKSSDYKFQNWTLDGQIMSTSSNYSFIMGDSATRLSANFQLNTSSNDYITDKKLAIYPNPATDYACIKSNDNIISIELFDLTGNKILKLKHNASDIFFSVKNLSSGHYLVKIETDLGSDVKSLIVKH